MLLSDDTATTILAPLVCNSTPCQRLREHRFDSEAISSLCVYS